MRTVTNTGGFILIVGDANMCEYATALKIGTTRLMLDVIARVGRRRLSWRIRCAAIRSISRDADLKQLVKRRSGGSSQA